MKKLLNAAQQKQAEQSVIAAGIPSSVLMERAAQALVDLITGSSLSGRLETRRIGVLCGYGNNGGDGLAAARLLHASGYPVFVTFVSDTGFQTTPDVSRLSEECLVQYRSALDCGVPFRFPTADANPSVWVDAVFGIGLNRPLAPAYLSCFETINQSGVPIVAADVPSGIDASTGRILGAALRCTATLCFGNVKTGVMLYPGAEYAGYVYSAAIGMDDSSVPDADALRLPEDTDVAGLLPKRANDSHKGTFGRLLCLCGSPGMCGAAILSARSAYRIGAGLVEILTCEANRIPLQTALPEAVLTVYADENDIAKTVSEAVSRAQAVLIGCGLGQSDKSCSLVRAVLETVGTERPLVIDADALNILAAHPDLIPLVPPQAVLTPHAKEASRLLGTTVETVTDDLVSSCSSLTERYGCLCLLKSSRSLLYGKDVVDPPVLIASGSSALAKAGSGDVLAGAIAGLCAESYACVSNPLERTYRAALCGAYLHGKSGEMAASAFGKAGVLASDTADRLGLARDTLVQS